MMKIISEYGFGRPPSEENLEVRRSVIFLLNQIKKDEKFTAPELARDTAYDKYKVLQALRFLESERYIVRVGTKKTADASGRPAIAWKKIKN